MARGLNWEAGGVSAILSKCNAKVSCRFLFLKPERPPSTTPVFIDLRSHSDCLSRRSKEHVVSKHCTIL